MRHDRRAGGCPEKRTWSRFHITQHCFTLAATVFLCVATAAVLRAQKTGFAAFRVDGGAPPAEAEIGSSTGQFSEPIVIRRAHPLSSLVSGPCAEPSRTTTVLLQATGGIASGAVAIGSAAVVTIVLASGRYVVSGGRQGTDLTKVAGLVAYPSYVLGSAAGVYWIGRARGHRGRFLPTLLGSAIGFGAPGATIGYHLSDPPQSPSEPECSVPDPSVPQPGDGSQAVIPQL